jgi:cytosine/adenosine deaminase-related metal-dependent hydrolase
MFCAFTLPMDRPFRHLITVLFLALTPWLRAETSAVKPVLVIQNGTLLTMQEGKPEPFVGYLVTGSNGKILAVGAGTVPKIYEGIPAIDATNKFIIPGFVSAHSHIWQTANRGLGADGTLFDWIGAFSLYTEASTPEDQYWYTLHGCLDFMKYGITSAYNFTFDGSRWTGYEGPVVPPLPGDWEQEQFKGEIESGMRFIHSFNLPWYDDEKTNHAKVVRFLDFTKAYASNPKFLKLGIAGNVAFADKKEWAYTEARYMKEFHLDNQMHMLEPPNGLNQREKFYWMKEAGMLGPSQYFGHFIHTTPEIIREAAKAGSNTVWQPMCNGRLGSGIADIPAYLKAGLKVGMGLDDQAASDIPDPFANMRFGLYLIRAKYEDASVFTPYDVLKMHTIGSATVMRVADKIGSLEVGKFADFLIIDPRNRDTGPVDDPYAHVVLACGQTNLESVYVGGQLVSQRGKILTYDFAKVSAEVHRRAGIARAKVQAELKQKLGAK